MIDAPDARAYGQRRLIGTRTGGLHAHRIAFRRWTGGLALVTIGLVTSLAFIATASAALPPNETYSGGMSSNDSVKLISDADGGKVTITTTFSGLDGCSGTRGATITLAPNTTSFFGGSATPSAPGDSATNRWFGGATGDGGMMIGTVSYDYPVSNTSCTTRATYLAKGTSAGTAGPGIPPRTVYRGAVSSSINLGVGGTIELSSGADKNVIDRLTISYTEGTCSYPVDLRDITLADGMSFHVGVRTPSRPAPTASVVGLTSGSSTILGGFSAPAKAGCPAVAGQWTARIVTAQSAAPTPTPTVTAPGASSTPAAGATGVSGRFAGSVAFTTSGQGLAVFLGGSVADLEASARGLQTGVKGVWAQEPNGNYQLLVVDGPAFLSDGFRKAFPTGFAGTTAVTLVR